MTQMGESRQRTPLYAWHVQHDARLVDFAGWDMPIQYTSIIDEHQAVRRGAGLFDISHMGRLYFRGPDALELIQYVYTNNAATLKEGQVRYGLVCNEQGGIRDDVLVYRLPDCYLMVVNAANRAKIVDWLGQHQGERNVTIDDRTLTTGMIAVQGPNAVALCQGIIPFDVSTLSYYYAAPTTYQGQPALVSRTGYTGEDGLELIVAAHQAVSLWAELARRGAKPCGLGARDTLRLEAAMPLYGHELTEEIDPFQAGLSWAVKLDKGDFLGRAALASLRQDATRPRRVGLESHGKRIPREGCAVRHEGRAVGRVTSGTFAPTLNQAIAMAYVEPALATPGTACAIDIRGKMESATVVSLPFYQRPKNA
ncbi:MAG: glycine cleavage system aminomethyltransferase GcvT [Gemmataceae bacterium]